MTKGALAPAGASGAMTGGHGPPPTTSLRVGLWASAVLHAVVVAVAVWHRSPPVPALPPVYRVELIAAPASPMPAPAPEAAPEAVAAAAPGAPAPAVPAPAKGPRPTSSPMAKAPAKPVAAKAVPAATRTSTPAPTPRVKGGAPKADVAPPAAAPTPAPVSAGGAGGDVVSVRTEGIAFPFPGYLQNIVRQVALRFRPRPTASPVRADVAFLLHRDGSVSSIRFVTRSGVYAFDLEAQGAIEAAASARAFGPLPTGFPDDVLPVTFAFDPRVLR